MQTGTDADAVKIVRNSSGDHTIYFHMDRKVSENYVSDFREESEKEARDLLRKILGIQGVQEAYVWRYKVKVEKTLAMEWDSIIPKVEEAIRAAV